MSKKRKEELMITILIIAALSFATSSFVDPPQTRTVKDRTLSSPQMPAVRLEFSQPFHYAGSQSFILYDVANAEQHFFVDADKDGRIRRMYWIQFEGYLPSNTHTYDYKSPKTVIHRRTGFLRGCLRAKRQNQSRPARLRWQSGARISSRQELSLRK